ncbi:hypothetical protein NDU88_005357 [Pleurodeles waltl]|uniref:Uncharacterized protein n=1 Tax=Pleurodeles waltl TaxID=8319 RepID=A0AAV7LNV8_PLEWA|nr:hypothetical protein NDU88_005357 [Pleurodeles waltl]
MEGDVVPGLPNRAVLAGRSGLPRPRSERSPPVKVRVRALGAAPLEKSQQGPDGKRCRATAVVRVWPGDAPRGPRGTLTRKQRHTASIIKRDNPVRRPGKIKSPLPDTGAPTDNGPQIVLPHLATIRGARLESHLIHWEE